MVIYSRPFRRMEGFSSNFKQVNEKDVTESIRKDYKDEFIHSCFARNSSTYVPEGASCPMK